MRDVCPIEGLVTVVLGGMTTSAPSKEQLEGPAAGKAKGEVSKAAEEPLEGLFAKEAEGEVSSAMEVWPKTQSKTILIFSPTTLVFSIQEQNGFRLILRKSYQGGFQSC